MRKQGRSLTRNERAIASLAVVLICYVGVSAFARAPRQHAPDFAAAVYKRQSPTADASATAPMPHGSTAATSIPAKFIPGLTAADLSQNVASQGFACSSSTDDTGETVWECTDGTGSFNVNFTGHGQGPIDYLSATSNNLGGGDATEAARGFLAYVATVLYDGANPAAASAWVSQHIGQEDVSTTIGAVTFTLYATGQARSLEVEPAGAP